MNAKLFNNLIPEYIDLDDDKRKKEISNAIFHSVIKLRMFGVVDNNPISLDELQFLRSENSRQKEEIKELKVRISDLSTKLLSLSTPLDTKVGVT